MLLLSIKMKDIIEKRMPVVFTNPGIVISQFQIIKNKIK